MGKNKFRRKEKELTPEEAVRLTIQENKPYWFDRSPLFSAVETDGGFALFPLDRSLQEDIWCLAFVDSVSVNNERDLEILSEWSKRYDDNDVKFLVVYRPRYGFQSERTYVSQFIETFSTKTPLVIDRDGGIGKALKIENFNSVCLIENNEVIYRGTFDTENAETEGFLQNLIRKRDPGLPLPRPYRSPTPILKHTVDLDLSAHTAPIADALATMSIETNGTFVHILADGVQKTADSPRLYIQINGSPVGEDNIYPEVLRDDSGSTYVEAKSNPQLFAIAHDLPDEKNTLTLTYSNSQKAMVRLYTLIVSRPLKRVTNSVSSAQISRV